MDYTSGIMPLTQVHKPPFTVEAPGYEKVPGETIPRRHPRAKNGLLNRPADDVATVFDLIRRSARVYPNHNAVGSRKLIKLHRETKKVKKNVDGEIREVDKEWQFFELSPFSFLTYKDYEARVLQLGAGLRKIGLTSENKLHIFAATSVQWISISHGCASQSISIVTAYDTLGESGVAHSLVQSKSSAMFVDPQLLKTAAGPIRQSEVKTVIINDQSNFAEGGEIESFKAANPGLAVYTYEEVRKLGEDNPVDPVPAKPQDLYCVMYTSGSTGPPKGACITHEALVAGITGLLTCVDECVSDKEVVLAYLPLAHIFEMSLENLVLFIGGTLGYGNPRTLSDVSVKDCAGDMRELRPTVMVGVPQVWETVRKGVMAKLGSSSPLIRSLFWGAFSYKGFMSRNKLPLASIFDGIVFSKVRELTGGRLRFTMNGASGIADGTKHFLSLVLAPMLVGYGLTETCANGALGCPLEYSPNAIGPIPAAIDVKLVSIDDLGYSTDAKVPQGEILLKGLPIMREYYDNPEDTAKALTPDGWFRTGDIGEFDADGHLRVIDRVKNLVKMQGGEYIALEKVESVYRGAQTVTNVMVHADAEHSRPIAIIMANEKILAEKASELGVDEHSMHADPKVRAAVLKDLQATGRRAGLTGMEIVAGVVVTDEEWTPPSGLVTATQKLNRKVIREKFKKDIDACLKNVP
ncbi:Long-chain-fatty-acid--CoA ligase [Purpureocillium takamizusanense]|uniref:Long-chain-fatty-acid--CoA ligase n=1 Tax=Purpureocillium takamizusanense TaxID=2060973 RepID=A0A9Q8QF34_9HYPO|nr:Long-chain-fatty-acid--CoA ligase [Purpureocillium takamizusanense]UNI18358.1 Long-chain-fatty-acid--CoA ligase [Purpureocillium takamizusanense]